MEVDGKAEQEEDSDDSGSDEEAESEDDEPGACVELCSDNIKLRVWLWLLYLLFQKATFSWLVV